MDMGVMPPHFSIAAHVNHAIIIVIVPGFVCVIRHRFKK
jgi:hypothetical protein